MKVVIVHKFGSTPSGPDMPPPEGLKEAGDDADLIIAVDESGGVVVKGEADVEVFS